MCTPKDCSRKAWQAAKRGVKYEGTEAVMNSSILVESLPSLSMVVTGVEWIRDKWKETAFGCFHLILFPEKKTKTPFIRSPTCPEHSFDKKKPRPDAATTFSLRHMGPEPKTLILSSFHQLGNHLTGGHGLGHQSLKSKLLLLEVVSRRVLNLELAHGLAEGLLNLVLLSALELERQCWVGDDLLNAGDVGLELLLGLEALAESLIVGLELLSLCRVCQHWSMISCVRWKKHTADHVLNLVRRELANGVGDCDVGAAAGGLLSGGDLEDTVDVDLEDNLENGLTSLHGRDRGKSELAEGGVVLAVDTLTLDNLLDVVGSIGLFENVPGKRGTERSAGCRQQW
jgi:hypothetical protein